MVLGRTDIVTSTASSGRFEGGGLMGGAVLQPQIKNKNKNRINKIL